MSRHDVAVLGAGLAGLSAARDLARRGRRRRRARGAQPRRRPGRADRAGRRPARAARRRGRRAVPRPRIAGWSRSSGSRSCRLPVAARRGHVGAGRRPRASANWLDERRRARAATTRAEEAFGRWPGRSTRTTRGRTRTRSGWTGSRSAQWLREVGAHARRRSGHATWRCSSLAAESVERTSLLSDLRKEAAAGAHGFYDYEVWECLRVAEGSATVALRMADELGHRDPLRHAGDERAGVAPAAAASTPRPASASTARRSSARSRSARCGGSRSRASRASASPRSTASATRSPPRSCSPTRARGGRSRARTARCTSRPA